MLLRGLQEEDFLQYKSPSMFLIFPTCDFKCEKECGLQICQNSEIIKAPAIEIEPEKLVNRYINNPITKAVVCGGLEPMDSFGQLIEFIKAFREVSGDPIVIYTGYRNDEVEEKVGVLSGFKNIIVKFGRFIPGQEPHLDPVLGVELASQNQYAVKIS